MVHRFAIGCCGSLDQAEAAQAAGFDYLECPLVSLRAEEDDAAFAPVLAAYQAAPLPVRAFNIFLPGELKVVGPAVDDHRVARYVTNALVRARQIGAEVVVFGSGAARRIPDGFGREQALEQLVHFLRLVADAAEANNLTIAIEPLNRKESNVINSVAEGVELAQRANRESIRVLADFYHMDEDGEPLSEISRNAAWLAHIHVADTGRFAPGTGEYPYPVFAEELRKAGYNGMVSMECRWNNFAAEAGPAVQFLRQAL
jgi:sugar phosphate isomerase/epimerase